MGVRAVALQRTLRDGCGRARVVEQGVLAEEDRRAVVPREIVKVEWLKDVVQRAHKWQLQLKGAGHPAVV
jgi:hypothetical protein